MVTIGYGRTDAADGRVFPWVFPMISTYWTQASAMINYIGSREGGMENLKGKKIVQLYLDVAYGKEPHSIFDKLAEKYGFEIVKIPVANPGNEQQAQWLQIRQQKPDYVILWGCSGRHEPDRAAHGGQDRLLEKVDEEPSFHLLLVREKYLLLMGTSAQKETRRA